MSDTANTNREVIRLYTKFDDAYDGAMLTSPEEAAANGWKDLKVEHVPQYWEMGYLFALTGVRIA